MTAVRSRPASMPAAAPPISERDFQRQVTDLAELFGWQWAHFRPAQTARGWRTPVSGPLGAGFPDLVLVNPKAGRLIFAELKRDGAKLTPVQHEVLVQLARLQEPESNCSCGLVMGVEFSHRGTCEYSKLNRGIQVFVWRPADLDAVMTVLR